MKYRRRAGAHPVALLLLAVCGADAAPDLSSRGFASAVKPLLQAHCYDCHGGGEKKGGLELDTLPADFSTPQKMAAWVRVFDRLHAGEMPPAKRARPPAAARAAAEKWFDAAFVAAEAKRRQSDGRVVLRRLNRVEYENTVHELLEVDLPLRDILPGDTPLHGFDTVGEDLRFSQLQMEKYLEAADTALDAAIVLTELPERFQKRMSLKDEKHIRENLDTPEGTVRDPVAKAKHQIIFRELPDALVLFSDGYSPTDLRQFSAPAPGRYRIRVSGYGWKSGGQPVTLRVYAHRFRGKRLVGLFEMPPDKVREVEFTAMLDRGELLQVVPHGSGFDGKGKSVWEIGGPRFEGVGLAVQWVEVEGPLGDWPPTSVKRLFGGVPLKEIERKQRRWRENGILAWELAPTDPRLALRAVVETFATRAFRRPLEAGEAEPFLKLALDALDEGRSFESAARLGLRAVLTAPQFLILVEQPGRLDDFALASRLSYFLWSRPPDDELLRLAAKRSLAQPAVLRAQTERLLASPKAREFVRNFTGQWLGLRNIAATSPDKRLYPEFDEMLPSSMVAETEAFFSEVLEKNLSVANFIQSDFLMLNRPMARHYGIDGAMSERFERVALPAGNPRGGLLTQAAILKVTANGTVTSPVMRGAWVMKNILGQPPQPPPAGVGSVEPDTRGATTIREQLD